MTSALSFSLVAVLLVGFAQAKANAAAECTAEKAQIDSLKAKMTSMETKIKDLEASVAAAKATPAKEDLPYCGIQTLGGAGDILQDWAGAGYKSVASEIPEVDTAKISDVAATAHKASLEALYAAYGHASVAAATAATAAKAQAASIAPMASELYGKHLSPLVGEYIIESQNMYTNHLQHHVAGAHTIYQTSVYPHVGKAGELFYTTMNTVMTEGTSLAPNLMKQVGDSMASATTVTAGPIDGLRNIKAELTKSREFAFGGKTFKFPYGYADMILAGIQALVMGAFVLFFVWKLFLKTIVWKILVKLGLKKVCFGVTKTSTKLSFKITIRLIKSFWFAVRLSLSLCFMCFRLCFTTAFAFCLVLSVQKGMEMGMGHPGIPIQIRIVASLALGLLFYLCCCCSRRKPASKKGAKGKEAANGVANGKPKAKDATPAKKTDAKAATKRK